MTLEYDSATICEYIFSAHFYNLSVLLGDVKDMESPPHNLIELLICPWLMAFIHLGGLLGPLRSGLQRPRGTLRKTLASGLWPTNVTLQAPCLVAISKQSNFSIESVTESFRQI